MIIYDNGMVRLETDIKSRELAKLYPEILKGMTKDPVVKAAVAAKAKEARDYWRSISPVSEGPSHWLHADHDWHDTPGDYRKSIKIKYQHSAAGFKATIYTHDAKARMIEYGNSKVHEYAPAARTAAHFGGTPGGGHIDHVVNVLDGDDDDGAAGALVPA